MKTLSFHEYESNQDLYGLKNSLIALNAIPKFLFVKSALYSAKYVEDIIPEKYRSDCLRVICTLEKYLLGLVTEKDCEVVCYSLGIDGLSSSPFPLTRDNWVFSVFHKAILTAAFDKNDSNAHVAHALVAADNGLIARASYDSDLQYPDNIRANFFRKSLPWNLVCAAQIAKAVNNSNQFLIENCQMNTKDLIYQIAENQQLVDYATIILGTENLREEFEFLIQDYFKKRKFVYENNIIL